MQFQRYPACAALFVMCPFGCGPGSPQDEGGTTGASETDACHDGPVSDEHPTTHDGQEPTSSGSGQPEGDGARPWHTGWQTVVNALPFPADISTLTIGRLEYTNNFANRGDVLVYFDQEIPVITVEMRVYDFADEITVFGDEYVEGTVERMQLWAYSSPGDPAPPSEMPPGDDCTVGTWKDGCNIHAYYDGQVMPLRAGIDLRVHLPRSYRGALVVTTEDNSGELGYPRLGNVVIDGLCGSGDVKLAQGSAAVKLCDALTPAPSCAPEHVAECEAAQWAPSCPCPPESYGRLAITAVKPSAGNITVDMPGTTWVNVRVANEDLEQPHCCVPEIANCGAQHCVSKSGEFSASAEYNYPGPAAPPGAGYDITATSAKCAPVSFYASPADWIDDISEPTVEQHGYIRVYTGCL